VIDAIDLDTSAGLGRFQTNRFNCLGFVLMLGPALTTRSKEILDEVSALPIEPGADLQCAASPVGNGIILRLAGLSVEQVGHVIYEHLKFVKGLLHDDPWSRKW